jgi:hypothetical protein
LSSAVVLETEVGQLALLDRLERLALAFGRDVDDATYAELVRASEHGTAYAIGASALAIPLLAVLVSLAVWAVCRKPSGGRASFRQVLAVVAHAGVILALRQVIAAPLTYARETLASPMTLNVLAPSLDEGSPVARFLASCDVFVIWWVTVLAIGVAVLYQRPGRRMALKFLVAYSGASAAAAGVMALVGGSV